MNKVLAVIIALGFTGVAYAATIPLSGGPTPLTSALINGTAPDYVGQLVVCTDCTSQNIGKGTVCQSTGTANGAWIISGSSQATTTACR